MRWRRRHRQRPNVIGEIDGATADLRSAAAELLQVVEQVKRVAAQVARLLPPPDGPLDA